jgi:hypothetical protein
LDREELCKLDSSINWLLLNTGIEHINPFYHCTNPFYRMLISASIYCSITQRKLYSIQSNLSLKSCLNEHTEDQKLLAG